MSAGELEYKPVDGSDPMVRAFLEWWIERVGNTKDVAAAAACMESCSKWRRGWIIVLDSSARVVRIYFLHEDGFAVGPDGEKYPWFRSLRY